MCGVHAGGLLCTSVSTCRAITKFHFIRSTAVSNGEEGEAQQSASSRNISPTPEVLPFISIMHYGFFWGGKVNSAALRHTVSAEPRSAALAQRRINYSQTGCDAQL